MEDVRNAIIWIGYDARAQVWVAVVRGLSAVSHPKRGELVQTLITDLELRDFRLCLKTVKIRFGGHNPAREPNPLTGKIEPLVE